MAIGLHELEHPPSTLDSATVKYEGIWAIACDPVGHKSCVLPDAPGIACADPSPLQPLFR
jgi:hypothetical protein